VWYIYKLYLRELRFSLSLTYLFVVVLWKTKPGNGKSCNVRRYCGVSETTQHISCLHVNMLYSINIVHLLVLHYCSLIIFTSSNIIDNKPLYLSFFKIQVLPEDGLSRAETCRSLNRIYVIFRFLIILKV
jgi:hypothetical protein